MRRIWKFPLEIAYIQTLNMPAGAEILTVQMQGDKPQLWAFCDTLTEVKERRGIMIYGTGTAVPPEQGKYIATFQMSNGELVFHAFEL